MLTSAILRELRGVEDRTAAAETMRGDEVAILCDW
jgi:hypothetical protein